jgi:hypothetical protein
MWQNLFPQKTTNLRMRMRMKNMPCDIWSILYSFKVKAILFAYNYMMYIVSTPDSHYYFLLFYNFLEWMNHT